MRNYLLLVVSLFLTSGCLLAQESIQQDIFFKKVMIFDGENNLGVKNLRVVDGKITEIGVEISPGENSTIVEGKGKFLMPGMIDSHTHAFFAPHLIQAAEFGVTTELDMMSMVQAAAGLRSSQASDGATNRADYFSAGAAVTVDGGHGTQFGFAVPTLAKAEDADQFILDRIAEGSDYIKIIVEDGSAYGIGLPTLTREAVQAAVKATKENGKLAVAHVGSASAADLVVEMGVDGLVHLFADQVVSEDWVSAVKSKEIFVVPTAAVVSNASGSNTTGMIIDDENISMLLTNLDLNGLGTSFPQRPGAKGSWEILKDNIGTLHANGVSILAGSDAPNPGTIHGASMHHELLLLVEAGLSPSDALTAATAAPADAFQLKDRGRIAVGLRADLLLVEGDPTVDITDLHRIQGVWKGGHSIDLSGRIDQVKAEREKASSKVVGESRSIDDFEGESAKAQFGFGWLESTDSMMGGSSTVAYKIVEGGADGSSSSLEISGQTQAQQPAFSGIMFGPGSGPMVAADLSSNESISFWAKGPAGDYTIMFFTQKGGMQPAMQFFKTTDEWVQYEFSFTDFAGTDGADVTGIWFGTNQSGEFKFQLDQVQLR